MNILKFLFPFIALFLLVSLAIPVRAVGECAPGSSICFGIDWKTTTVADIADVDVKARDFGGQTALMYAAWHSPNPKIIRALVDMGANTETRNVWGVTALMLAVENVNPEIIHALVDAGANTEARDQEGKTALMYAAGWKENPKTMQALLDAGADVAAHAEEGRTAIMYAAMNANPEIIQILMNANENVNSSDIYGETVLMRASGWNKNPEIIRILADAGADVNAHTQFLEATALMYAVQHNTNPEIVSALLDVGADAKAKDADGKTAWNHIQDNDSLKGTDAYWALNDLRH